MAASISFAGTLKNTVQSAPIDLNGTIYYQSCLATADSNEIVIKAKNTNIECHVKFSSNDSQGKKICDMTKENQIESAICAPSSVTNPAVMYFDFDGANFSYTPVKKAQIPTKCVDLSGDWKSSPDSLFEQALVMRVKQDGCKKVAVEYLSNPTQREPFPTGTYINDGATSPSWDDKHNHISTISEKGMSVEYVVPGYGWYAKLGLSKNGWTALDLSYPWGNGYPAEVQFIKMNQHINEGSCHNLNYSQLPVGFICKTSSGFRWKKTLDGWADLSPKGKSWTFPSRSNWRGFPKDSSSDYYADYVGVGSAVTYCKSLGKQLPTVPKKAGSESSLKIEPKDFDYESSDGYIAHAHEMKEVILELSSYTLLTANRVTANYYPSDYEYLVFYGFPDKYLYDYVYRGNSAHAVMCVSPSIK